MTVQQDEILSLLRLAQEDFALGDQDAYDGHLAAARTRIDALASPERMLGEWELIARLSQSLDADRMLDCLRRADKLLGGRRSALTPHIPLNLGSDSILSLFYLRGDSLDNTLPKIREAATLYDRLTGSGLGFDTLFEAETAYYRCELDTAAVLSHQVVYIARNTGQLHLAACGANLLAQIAKHRGDADGWTYAVHVVNNAMSEVGEGTRTYHSINMTRYELAVILGDFESIPAWLRDGILHAERGNGVLGLGCRARDASIPMIRLPMTMWTHVLYLLLTGQHDRVLAMDMLQHSLHIDQSIPILDLYFSQARAISYLARGDREGASAILASVVDRVLPERALMILAELAPLTAGVTNELVKEKDEAAFDSLMRISRDMPEKPRRIWESVAGVHAVANLTTREREVASLAADGMSNKEIADTLCITQQTVKFHLGNVYQKLSVTSRSRMAAILRNR